MKWKTLQKKYIYKSKWVTLRMDEVELPNKVLIPDFYVLEYPSWVNVIALTVEGCLILERQFRYGIGEVYYELPAGVCNEGESPLEAARRELLEETGYTGGEWKEWMLSAPNANTMNNYCHTFLAVGVEKRAVQQLDETELLEVGLFEKEKVREMLETGKIVEADMVAPLWRYMFYNK